MTASSLPFYKSTSFWAPCLLGLLGVAASFWGGQHMAKRPPQPNSPPAKTVTADAKTAAPHGKSATAVGELETRLQQLEKAAAADMPGIWAAAYTRFQNEADLRLKTETLELILLRWAELDPAGALALVGGAGPAKLPSFSEYATTILAAWAEQDLAAALATAQAFTRLPSGEGDSGFDAVIAAGGQLLKTNPQVFWEWFTLCRKPLPDTAGENYTTWLALARSHSVALEAIAKELAAQPPEKTSMQSPT